MDNAVADSLEVHLLRADTEVVQQVEGEVEALRVVGDRGLHHVLLAACLDGQLATRLTDLLHHTGDKRIFGGIRV